MHWPPRFIPLSVLLIGLAACSTSPTPPSRDVAEPTPKLPTIPPATFEELRTPLADRVASANAVYLGAVERDGGVMRERIVEIWRHDAALGPPPTIGSEWRPEINRPATGQFDQVLIVIEAAPRGHSTSTIPVKEGRLLTEPTRLSSLRTWVSLGRPARPIAPRPGNPLSIEGCIQQAEDAYFLTIHIEDGMVRYRVAEVWRRRSEGPGLAVGAEAWRAHPTRPGASDGAAAVLFRLPMGTAAAGAPSTREQLFPVRNGHVGSLRLTEVRRRVLDAE